MITKRTSINTGTLVLFVAAMLVILTVAIASSVKSTIRLGNVSLPKRQPVSWFSSQVQVPSNFDAHDYYMTHPKAQAATNFDAHDYYMTHPKAQAATNFDAHDYYMTHPKAPAAASFDAHDYYMTHPKGFDR